MPFIQTLLIKLSIALGLIIATILYFYRSDLSKNLSENFKILYLISYNKWYVDELYSFLFVKPFFYLASFFWKRGDIGIIDAYGPNGASKTVKKLSKFLSIFQSGYLYHYAFVMLGGLVIILTWIAIN